MDNKTAANAIRIIGVTACLATAWQAVRFCHGNIGAPVVDQVNYVMMEQFGRDASSLPAESGGVLTWIVSMLSTGYYYVLGVLVWLLLAALVMNLFGACARIAEVGFDQYSAESKAAAEANRRLAEHNAEIERRRELRRKRREALRPKSSFSFGAVLLGITIGVILL